MTVRTFINPTITLYSGVNFDFTSPETSNFTIEDIAHALSNTCRFAGHCYKFYSVAEHSVNVSRFVPEQDAYAGLLHDAAEAFIHDISKPLKALLPDYKVIEKRIEMAVFERLGVPNPLPDSVRIADVRMLITEQKLNMPDEKLWNIDGQAPFELAFLRCWTPREAKAKFLERYRELLGNTRKDLSCWT